MVGSDISNSSKEYRIAILSSLSEIPEDWGLQGLPLGRYEFIYTSAGDNYFSQCDV